MTFINNIIIFLLFLFLKTKIIPPIINNKNKKETIIIMMIIVNDNDVVDDDYDIKKNNYLNWIENFKNIFVFTLEIEFEIVFSIVFSFVVWLDFKVDEIKFEFVDDSNKDFEIDVENDVFVVETDETNNDDENVFVIVCVVGTKQRWEFSQSHGSMHFVKQFSSNDCFE